LQLLGERMAQRLVVVDDQYLTACGHVLSCPAASPL
jgi:hypothetical protein